MAALAEVQAKIRPAKKTRGPEIRSMKSFSTVMCDIFSVHTDGVLVHTIEKARFLLSVGISSSSSSPQ